MEARRMLLIAFGLAIGLPYITVALIRGGGQIGIYVIAGLFFGVIALIVLSDRNEDESTQTENT